MLEKLKGFKTFILGAGIGIPSLVCAFADQFQAAGIDIKELLGHVVPIEWVGVIGTAIAILVILCRVFTTSAIFKKD